MTTAAAPKAESKAIVLSDPKALKSLLQTEEARARITPMLRGVSYDRILGEVFLVTSDSPAILQCTPGSIVGAVARACSWGLAIGETVHLVPFNTKVKGLNGQKDRWEMRCKAVQDYKGKIELIVAAGGAKSINAQCVYEKEHFEYLAGTSPQIIHRPAMKASERGALIGAYAVGDHGAGRAQSVVWMPLADIDAIRLSHSKQWKEGACPPWYARKCAVHQLAKMLPKSALVAKAMKRLLEDETEIDDVVTDDVGGARPASEPVAVQSAVGRDERCICDAETGEQDPNCPIHGDHV